MEIEILYGKKAELARRNRINELHLVVKGNRGWKDAFLSQYPHLNNYEGTRLLDSIPRGVCSDAEILRCFEDFIPFIQEQQPEWFKKQLSISITEIEA